MLVGGRGEGGGEGGNESTLEFDLLGFGLLLHLLLILLHGNIAASVTFSFLPLPLLALDLTLRGLFPLYLNGSRDGCGFSALLARDNFAD